VRPFDFPLTREAMDFATRWPGAEDSAELERLGVPQRDPRETLADTVRWLYEEGHLERRHVGRLAEPR
jgi:hypothetical protein